MGITDCKVIVPVDQIYAAIKYPPMIMKINGPTGTLIDSRLIMISTGILSSYTTNIHQIEFSSLYSKLVIFFSDLSPKDGIIIVDPDIQSNQYSTWLHSGNYNYAASKAFYLDSHIETYATLNVSNVTTTSLHVQYLPSPYSRNYYFNTQMKSVVKTTYHYTPGHHRRTNCQHENSELLSGITTSAIFYEQDWLTAAGNTVDLVYLYNGLVGQTVRCQEVIITDDYRDFVLFSHYESAGVSKYQTVNEIIRAGTTAPFSYSMVVQKLQAYWSTSQFNGFNNFFVSTQTSTSFFFYHFMNAETFQDRGTNTFSSGYFVKDYITTSGSSSLVLQSGCLTSAATLSSTIALTKLGTVSESGQGAPSNPITGLNLYADTNNNVNVAISAISSYANYQCSYTVPSISVSQPFTTNSVTQYYFNGCDPSPMTLDLYALTTLSALSATDKQLLSCSLTVTPSTFPTGVSFSSYPLQVILTSGSTPGTYTYTISASGLFELTAISLTLIIVPSPPVPATPSFCPCFIEPVVPQGGAFDAVYQVGSLMRHKLNFQAPLNSFGIPCQPILMLAGYQVNSGTLSALPFFMSVDEADRVLKVFLPAAQADSYLSKTYLIQVDAWILGMVYPIKSFNFQVFITNTTDKGCPGYYYIKAAIVDDIVLTKSSPAYQSSYQNFTMSDQSCSVKFQTRMVLSNYDPAPSCIQVDQAKSLVKVTPSKCDSGTYTVRLEAWFTNKTSFVMTHTNFTVFRVTIIPSTPVQCSGQLKIVLSNVQRLQTYAFFDIDNPSSQADSFASSLDFGTTFLPLAPSSISTCEVSPLSFSASAYQDQEFNPSLAIGLSTAQQYSIGAPSKVGIYDIKLVGQYLKDVATYPRRYDNIGISTVYLSLHVYQSSLCKIKAADTVPQEITYQMKNKNPPFSMKVRLPPFEIETEGCIYDKLHYELLSRAGGSLPGFVIFDPSKLLVTIASNTLRNYGLYTLEYSASLNPYLIKFVRIDLNVLPFPNTSPPKLLGTLMDPFKVTVGAEGLLKIPEMRDPDNDPFSVSVTYSSSATFPSFITYDAKEQTFKVTPMETDVGTYTFLLNLTDSHPLKCKTNIITINIEVDLFSPAQYAAALAAMQSTQKTQYVEVTVSQVSSTGMLQLGFNMSLFNNYQGTSQFNNQSLQIQMIKAYSLETYPIQWNITNVTANAIYIQLNFSDPSTVSIYSQQDQLVVSFKQGVPLLASQVDIRTQLQSVMSAIQAGKKPQPIIVITMTKASQYLKASIPKQTIQSSLGAAMKQAGSYLKNSANTILFGNLVLNIFMSSSIQMLWGTINTLQLIVMTTLFNLNFPDNCIVMFNIVAEISQFSLVPTTAIVNGFFTFAPSQPVNDNFEAMGYSTTSILQNMNTMLIFIVGILPVFVIVKTLDFCLSEEHKQNKWFKAIYSAVFFSTTLRTMLEGYIEMSLCSTINLFDVRSSSQRQKIKYSLLGDQASLVISIIVGLLDYLMPFGLLYFVWRSLGRLEDKDYIDRFGSLFEGLKTKQPIHLLCTFFFVVRRLLLVFVAILLKNHPAAQVMIFIMLSELSIMYLIYFKPYDDPFTNNNEIFNEACVLLSSYQLFVFTDFVSDALIKKYTGYLMIGTILINFGTNILIQIISAVTTLPRAFKKMLRSPFCRKHFGTYARKGPAAEESPETSTKPQNQPDQEDYIETEDYQNMHNILQSNLKFQNLSIINIPIGRQKLELEYSDKDRQTDNIILRLGVNAQRAGPEVEQTRQQLSLSRWRAQPSAFHEAASGDSNKEPKKKRKRAVTVAPPIEKTPPLENKRLDDLQLAMGDDHFAYRL